jgi:hypothetical protein
MDNRGANLVRLVTATICLIACWSLICLLVFAIVPLVIVGFALGVAFGRGVWGNAGAGLLLGAVLALVPLVLFVVFMQFFFLRDLGP